MAIGMQVAYRSCYGVLRAVKMTTVVGLEVGPTEGANDGTPCPPVDRHVAEPGGGLHVGDARPAAASRADPRSRLRAPHHLSGVH
ncbi:hypothetical protein MA16_Dca011477 [Dendrobium catenatum]|uniref:Uncharacterized protein n=1 Tax=Dendrobium catenatum TaxID=906689 RepID=A0A2I0VFP5_9ASPA|nr:hypothetical protein MA16_Dca011477 [Dendrobium catenatum]